MVLKFRATTSLGLLSILILCLSCKPDSKKSSGGGGAKNCPSPSPYYPNQQTYPNTQNGTGAIGDWNASVYPVMQRYCINCHGSVPSQGASKSLQTQQAFMLTNQLRVPVGVDAVLRMKGIGSRMPPQTTGQVPTQQEIAQVCNWVASTFPNNAQQLACSSLGGNFPTAYGSPSPYPYNQNQTTNCP